MTGRAALCCRGVTGKGSASDGVSGPPADRVQRVGPPPGTPIDHRPCKGSAVFFLLMTARPAGSMLAAGTGVQQTGTLAVMGSRDDSGGLTISVGTPPPQTLALGPINRGSDIP